MAAAIEICGLRKEFGGIAAVESLSLAVPAGACFGFLGPNGAGKSTTIGCLTGLYDPTAGSITVLDQRMHADAIAVKRRIGVMPETLALFEGLYASEFLVFQARMYGLDHTTTGRRVMELLEALELVEDGHTPLARLSAGMRKRVAFAAAIVHTPEVVFLDEPFVSIDPAGVAMMKGWLRRIVAQGRTVFLTTHVLETAERLCDRVAIISRPGRLMWQGDVSTGPRSSFVIEDREFDNLERLYLHLTGERTAMPKWL